MEFHLRKLLALALLCSAAVTAHAAPKGGGGTATAPKAVATFESIGLYWAPGTNPGAAGCQVQYRKAGDTAWTPGHAMWFDARNNECRGSLVQLAPGTSYEIQFGLPGQAFTWQLTASTWSDTAAWPIAKVVVVPSGAQSVAITEGGTPSGYVLYTAADGGSVIDVANGADYNVTVNAPYVIVRGLTLKGARVDGVRLLGAARNVVIEDNDISGWGTYRTTLSNGLQVGNDYQAGIRCESVASLERVVVQRNRIHDPRYSANSWSFGHPIGPQGITFNYCGGNNVIRYNEITGADGHYYNDGIGGSDNYTGAGFPNYDSDIYGNLITHTWDDAIEAEGGNRNVRIWGNYMDQTTTGVATTVTDAGPVYIFRNVYNRSRQLSEVGPDSDDRNNFAKSGSTRKVGNGRRYVFHNTLLQMDNAGTAYPLGAGGGVAGAGSDALTNTVTRNNVLHIWKSWWASIDDGGGTGNDLDYDLFNGNITARGAEVHGILGTPIYAAGSGWPSGSGGMYQLDPRSPGYGAGTRIPNFNDGLAAPDMGAHQSGTAPMCFGKACSAPVIAP
jgi:hypothetical protein